MFSETGGEGDFTFALMYDNPDACGSGTQETPHAQRHRLCPRCAWCLVRLLLALLVASLLVNPQGAAQRAVFAFPCSPTPPEVCCIRGPPDPHTSFQILCVATAFLGGACGSGAPPFPSRSRPGQRGHSLFVWLETQQQGSDSLTCRSSKEPSRGLGTQPPASRELSVVGERCGTPWMEPVGLPGRAAFESVSPVSAQAGRGHRHPRAVVLSVWCLEDRRSHRPPQTTRASPSRVGSKEGDVRTGVPAVPLPAVVSLALHSGVK